MTDISKRIGHLLNASVNTMVDAIENVAPEIVMEQSIRDIDDAITEVKAERGKATAGKHLARKKLAENSNTHEGLTGKAELALASDREDLAEIAIKSQIDLEKQVPILEATIADCKLSEKELDDYVEALTHKRKEMRDELHAYNEAQKSSPAKAVLSESGQVNVQNKVNNKISDAEQAFDRVSGSLKRVSDTTQRQAKQMAELDGLVEKSAIQERLESLKAKCAK